MTAAELRAYQRGYNARTHGKWPAHKPPAPPVSLVAEIMLAARELRDAIDGELAKFDEDDELNIALSPHIDRVDAIMRAVSGWLTAPDASEAPDRPTEARSYADCRM